MHVSAWLGAGVLAAGVSAALIAGAHAANADTTSPSGASSKSDTSASPSSAGDRTGPRRSDGDEAEAEKRSRADEKRNRKDSDTSPEEADSAEPQDSPSEVEVSDRDELRESEADSGEKSPNDLETAVVQPDPGADAKRVKAGGATAEPRPQAAVSLPSVPSLPDLVQSLVFDAIGAAVTFVAGPPVVPAGSTVTVRTSSLHYDEQHNDEQHNVPAHWYYPGGDQPPQRMILLQHGFLGVGAMYSHTAANLAERTNSIVVVPTLSSNRFVREGFWLGDDQALRATAALFAGDRAALTASAIAAGHAQRYGVGVPLPGRFALVGHSLGGNLVAGAAGYYADAVTAGDADNQLAGVILLDAAPQQNVLADALDKLDGLSGYTPVFELGAPKESRRVDAALNEHRPGRFNGLVLRDGRHLDAMQGGTWLIQLISHLYQGFPTAQNQAAAQTLVDGWAADILDGRIDAATGRCDGAECAGIYGEPGQTLSLETPAGPTSGTVIGVAQTARMAVFEP